METISLVRLSAYKGTILSCQQSVCTEDDPQEVDIPEVRIQENGHGSGINDFLFAKTECPFKVLSYKVPRKDYGRFDYNAAIAQRIHSNLLNANLDEPDIIKDAHLTFRVLIPNTGEYSKLIAGEQVTDITNEKNVIENTKASTNPNRLNTQQEINKGMALTDTIGNVKENKSRYSRIASTICFIYENSNENPDWPDTEETRMKFINLLSKEATPSEKSVETDVLYLEENPVEKLQYDSAVYRFLTLSFEKKIFAYAERALQFVETQLSKKRDDKEKTLSYTRLEIHSLLSRKLPEHDTTAKPTSEKHHFPYRLVSDALHNGSMQSCGIKGFCNTIDGLLVLVAEPIQQDDRTKIANRIEECLQDLLKDEPKIVWVETIATSDLAAQGCRLNKKGDVRWATLGCFGRDADESLVAITAGHFVKEGQIVRIENIQKDFGRCVQSQNLADVDIAIVNINDDMKHHCVFPFLNENGDVCNASVYQEAQIKNWPVHKKGAATHWTSGVVYTGEATVCKEEGILINGNMDNADFAIEGDSGSIVFFYDPKDLRNREVKLLSIVSKQVKVKSGAIPVGLSRKPTLTRSLKDGLEKTASFLTL